MIKIRVFFLIIDVKLFHTIKETFENSPEHQSLDFRMSDLIELLPLLGVREDYFPQ